MTKNDKLEKFENIMLFCCTNDFYKRLPVGQAVENLPEATKEFLRTLKSDDFKNLRFDYVKGVL